MATITIAGREVQVIVDSSAGDEDGALTLSHDVIAQARGVRLGDAVMNDALGRQFIRPRFRIPIVIVGGHEYHDIHAVEALPPETANSPIPNVMGKYFLSRHFVVVDFASATIDLWPRDIHAAVDTGCGPTIVAMERTHEPRLAVSTFGVANIHMRLLWSTSASHSILSEAAAKRLRLATAVRGPGIPNFFEAKTFAAASREFGPQDFVVLQLQLPEDSDGVIGGDFLAKHVVCFDYQRREVRVR